jgi:4-alpha-glucanotransferase
MKLPARCSGLVLHLTSLPGPHGSGDLGPEAHAFVDWLASARQSLWQVLPLNPPGFGDSPYQAVSALAGSPLLVALQPLQAAGWLQPEAVPAAFADAGARIDFGAVNPWRLAQLRRAWAGFGERATATEQQAFVRWCEEPAQAAWLPDYSLFMALHGAHGHQPWWCWDEPLRRRDAAALQAARAAQADETAFWCWVQWCFEQQLQALRAHARASGVALVGDLPIFVAHDSADCWARPDLFQLGDDGQPTAVAGVPPDGYSADGQRWGNPLYRWDRMAAEGFAWWRLRVQRLMAQTEVFRVDHFRGFAACWEVPASSPTAREGRWVGAPGQALFDALQQALGPLPLVAEDLGLITPDVVALREHFGWPGMRIVYEGFLGEGQRNFLPHHHVPNALAYTSTHDSDTVRGFWDGATPAQRALATAYLGLPQDPALAADAVAWGVLRITWASVAQLALATAQDLLGADTRSRMNLPGTAAGNWGWRLPQPLQAGGALAQRLAALTLVTGRA